MHRIRSICVVDHYSRASRCATVPDSFRLFGSNDRVDDFNLTRLKELKEPVARVNAVSRGAEAAKLDAASFESIKQVAFFAFDANVLSWDFRCDGRTRSPSTKRKA